MRFISGTYTFLEAIIVDLLERLSKVDSDEALVLALEGRRLFEYWANVKQEDGGRKEVTESLTDFNRRALDYLQGKSLG